MSFVTTVSKSMEQRNHFFFFMAEIAHNLYVLHTLHFFPCASDYGQIHCIKWVISFFKKSLYLNFIINGIISGTMNKGILTVVVVVVAAVVERLF